MLIFLLLPPKQIWIDSFWRVNGVAWGGVPIYAEILRAVSIIFIISQIPKPSEVRKKIFHDGERSAHAEPLASSRHWITGEGHFIWCGCSILKVITGHRCWLGWFVADWPAVSPRGWSGPMKRWDLLGLNQGPFDFQSLLSILIKQNKM